MVKNHISLKKVFEYSVILKISYQSWFLVYLQLPQARLLQHPRLLQVRKLITQITIQQSSQVKVWMDKHGETRALLKHQKSYYMNQPKFQNQIKMRITNRYGEARLPTYQNGCKNWERILWRKEFLNTETHTRVPLRNHLYNPWDVWIWASTVFILTSRETEIARFSRGPKSQGHRAEDVLAESYLVHKILVIWLQPITKLLVNGVNLGTIIDMQS